MIKRIIKALGYSLHGLQVTWQSEPAFRQEVVVAVIMIPIALWLHVGAASKAIMISSIVWVLLAELANTAIEAVVDRISKTPHLLSKKAKDVGSAIVFVTILNALLVWIIVLLLG